MENGGSYISPYKHDPHSVFIVLDFGTKDLGEIFHFLSLPLACTCKSLPNLADSHQGKPLECTLHSPL